LEFSSENCQKIKTFQHKNKKSKMDDNNLSGPLNPQVPQPVESLEVPDTNVPISSFASIPSPSEYATESNLEVHSEVPLTVAEARRSVKGFSRRKALTVSAVITAIVVLFTGSAALLLGKNAPRNEPAKVVSRIPVQEVGIQDTTKAALPSELQGAEEALLVTTDIITRGSLKFSNSTFVTVLKPTALTSNQTFTIPDASGTLCLDSNNCGFATQNDVLSLQTQLGQIVVPSAQAASVVNNQTGSVAIQGTSNQVSVTTTNGSITLSTPQDLAQISSPTFAGLALNGNLSLTGIIDLPLNCTAFLNGGALTTNASGQIICSDDEMSGAGTSVTTPGGTIGTIPVFTAADVIGDSLLSQALGTVTIGGNSSVTGTSLVSGLATFNGGVTLQVGDVLTVNGDGFTDLTGNGLQVSGSSLALNVQANKGLEVDVNGLSLVDCALNEVLKYNGANQWACASDAAGSGAPDTDPFVTVGNSANLSGERAINPTGNLTGTDGGADGSYSINTIANPSFTTSVTTPLLQSSGALSITPGGALTVGSTGQTALLQGSTTTITSTGAGNDIVLTPADRVRISTLDCTGFANGGVLTTDASGNISCADDNGDAASGITGTGTANRMALFTGANTIADSWLLQNGSTLELDNTRSLSLTGGNFSVTGTGQFSGLLSANGNLTIEVGDTLTFNGDAFTDLTGTGLQISTGSLQTTLGTSVDLASVEVTGILPVANGGTGVNGSAAANGQLLIGNGSGYTLATLTQGAGITISNGAGSISVASTLGATVESAEITDLTVTGGDIADDTITLGTKTTGNYVATITNGSGISGSSSSEGGTPTIALGALTANWNQTGAFDIVLDNSSAELQIREASGAFYGVFDIADLSVGNSTYTFPDLAGGSDEVCLVAEGNCAGSGSGITGSGTQDQLSKFGAGGDNIVDSTISDDGSTVTTTVDLAVQGGAVSIGTALQDAALTLYGNGFAAVIDSAAITGAQSYNLPDGSGEFCIKELGNCSGAGGGNAPQDAEYLVLSLNGGLSAERTLSFNGTNFSVVDNGVNNSYTVNTAQNINSTATPTFGGLTLNGNVVLGSNTIQGTTAVIDFTNFDLASNGNLTAGTYNGQTISATASFTGTLGVTGLTTLNGGLTVEAGDTVTFNGDAFTDFTGNGLTVTSNTLTIITQANKGLEVDSNGLSLIDCVSGEILKYNGSNQWACATDTSGSGDNVNVNSTAVTDANFVDTAADGTTASVTWTIDNVPNPDEISITVGVASDTEAGVITTGAQDFAGVKTFTGEIIAEGDLTIQAGDTFTINSDAFTDLTGNGLQVTSNALTLGIQASKGLEVDVNGLSLIDCANGELLKYNGSNQWACGSDIDTDTNTTYSAGNDLDLSGTTFDIESQLDFVATINQTGADLTLQTTTSGNIIVNSAGTVELQDNTNVTGTFTVSSTAAVQGSSLTIGAAAQQGSLIVHDGDGETVSITIDDIAASSTLKIPDTIGANDTFCFLTLANCAGAGGGITGSGTNGQVAFFNGTGTITSDADFLFDGANVAIGGDLQVNGGDITSTGTLNISSATTNSISLDSGTTGAINIGVGANSKTLTLGNATGTTAVSVNCGSGICSFGNNATDHSTLVGSATGVSATTIYGGSSGISLVAASGSGVTVGSPFVQQAVVVGSTITTSSTTIQAGTGDLALISQDDINIGTNAVAQDITLGNSTGATSITLNSGTGAISIGTGAQARTTNIATGTAVQTVTLGSVNSTSSLLLQSGTGDVAIQSQDDINVGTNAVAQDITIGNGTGTTSVTVNCGTGLCTFGNNNVAHTTAVGSSMGASATNIFSGTGDLALQSQDDINIGTNAVAQDITIGNATGATSVNITAGSGGINLNTHVVVASQQTIRLVGGTTAQRPVSPAEGMLYFDTDTKQLLVYGGAQWQNMSRTATKVVAASTSQNPAGADYQVTTAEETAGDADSKIQSAINALPSAGGTVYLMEGTYTIDTAIILPDNVTLSGAGRSTIIKLKDNINATMNAIENSDRNASAPYDEKIIIRDLSIDGNKTNNTGSQYGINLLNLGAGTNQVGATITNVISEQFNQHGIYIQDSYNNLISNNITRQNGSTGIWLGTSTVSNSVVTGNTSSNNTSSGIYVAGDNNRITDNNMVSNFAFSLSVFGSRNTVSANVMSGTTSYNLRVGSGSYNAVTGNTINSGTSGIYLTSGNYSVISDNVITDTGSLGGTNGITISNSDSNSITGNKTYDGSCSSTCYSIELDATSDNNYIADNTFTVASGTPTINDLGVGTSYGGQFGTPTSYLIQPNSAITIQSSTTNSVTIDSGTTGAINIGTNANGKTITIGNSTGGTSVAINCGTGACNFGNNAIAHTTNIGNSTGTSTTNIIGGSGGILLSVSTGNNISIGNPLAVQNVTVGVANTTSSLLLQSGTGDIAIQSQDDINIGTNAVAQDIVIGNSTGTTSVNVNCGTGACSFGSNATAHTTTLGSSTGAATTTINAGTGGLNLGNNALANTITLGNTSGAVNQTINIGTNATASTVTDINIGGQPSGTGSNVNINANNTNFNGGTVNMFTANSGTLNIGATLFFGSNLNIGSTVGTSATLIRSGTGDVAIQSQDDINIGTNAVAQDITIGNVTGSSSVLINAGTGVIGIGTTAQARTVNIANGAAAQTVTLGSTNTTSSLVLQSGTGDVAIQSQDDINIGTNAIAQDITIGNIIGATGVTINGGTNDVTINSQDDVMIFSGDLIALSATGATTAVSTNFNLDSTGNLTLGGALVVAGGSAGNLYDVGTSLASGNSAALKVSSGSSGAFAASGDSGDVTLQTGAALGTASGTTGDLLMTTGHVPGAGATGNSGSVTISTGHITNLGDAGAISISPGNSKTASGTGALVTIQGGNHTGTTSAGGSVTLDAGTGTSSNGGITVGGTNALAVNLGNTTGSSSVNLQAGSGGVNVTSGTMTVGTASTQGNLVLHDGDGETVTITIDDVASSSVIKIPDAVGATDTFCLLTLANCSGSATTLQASYDADVNGSDVVIGLSSTDGALLVRDNATPLGTTLFAIQNSAGTSSYLGVTATGVTVAGTISVPGTGSGSERFGAGSATTGGNSLAVGNGASANSDSTAIGYNASTTAGSATALGQAATADFQSTSVGRGATSTNSGVAVGYNANSGAGISVAIGVSSSAVGDSTVLGHSAQATAGGATALGQSSSAGSNSIAIGRAATTTAANQLVIGSTTAAISNGYFGNGVTAATPQAFTLQSTGSSAAGTSGADFTLKAGAGTTTGTGSHGGSLTLQGGNAGGSGDRDGGDVYIEGGTAVNNGGRGDIILQQNGGSVGIGTLPGRTFHVQSGGNYAARFTSTQADAFIEFQSSGTGSNLPAISTSTDDLKFWTNGNNQLTISSAGLVTLTNNLTVQGGTATVGGASTQGSLLLHDGDGETVTITIDDIASSSTIKIPDTAGTADTFCLATLANCSGLSPNLSDNVANALDIQEGTNNYININTTDSSENISFGNATTNPSFSFLGTGTLSIAGSFQVDNNVVLGSSSADTVTFNGYIASNLIPATDDTYDLGSTTNRWQDLYLGPSSLHIGTNGDEGVLSYNTTNNYFNFNQNVTVQSGTLTLGQTSTTNGQLTLLNSTSSFGTTLQVDGTLTANRTIKLPDADGTLTTSGGATQNQNFTFTGNTQTFVVPVGVTSITYSAYGAEGYDTANASAGLGASVSGTMSVTPGETITIVVGGAGGAGGPRASGGAGGGYNGGGNAFNDWYTGGGGGGASDIRQGGSALANRVVVAAGGGGGGGGDAPAGNGGAGGAVNGSNGAGPNPGLGATTSAGGAAGGGGSRGQTDGTLGQGGQGTNINVQPMGGGGGGGLYGGGGGGVGGSGSANSNGGGGGSSLVPGGASSSTGVRTGNGLVSFSWTPGTGAINKLAVFTNSTNLAASVITQLGTSIGINVASPTASLDILQSSTSTTADTLRGGVMTVSDTGIVTSGTDTTYGQRLSVTRTGATGGTINTYGLDIQAVGDTGGTSTVTGLNVNVSGGDTNYAAIFQGGNVGIGDATPTEGRLVVSTTGAAGTVAQVLIGDVSQTADLLQFQNANGTNAKFSATGAELTLGRVASSGTVTQGKLILSDGTTSNFSTTLQVDGTLTANRTIRLPNSDGVLTTSGGAVSTQNFVYTGAEQTFVVPEGVTQINAQIAGARGGTSQSGVAGAAGAIVTATIDVTPGETLRLYIGSQGSGSTGGYNGGGAGGTNARDGGGGGGASDVRRGGSTLADRFIVAGGGGGAASNCENGGSGGAGGAGGTTGASGAAGTGLGTGTPGGGGGGGTGSAGGSGASLNGAAGVLGVGGAAGSTGGSVPGSQGNGGGGGGGYYGGGAGGSGSGSFSNCAGGGGGGGGSSLIPAGGSVTGTNTSNGYVSFSYTVATGSSNKVALFTSASNLTASVISQVSGQIGINVASPTASLDVLQSSASITAGTLKGVLTTVTDTGAVTTGTDTTHGQQISVTRTGATGGTINTFGLDIQAIGDNAGSGTSTLTGLNVNVSGADTNYSALFQGGNVGIGDTTPASLFTVGSGDLFQVDSSGAIAAVVGITSSGNILPSTVEGIDLGSSTAELDEIYLGDGSGVVLGLDQDATLGYDEATDDRVELAGSGASLFIEDRLSLGVDARTIADDGTPLSNATLTLTPTASYVEITCDDTSLGCDITMGEGSAKEGDMLVIMNISGNSVLMSDTANVSELGGGFTMGQYDTLTLIYSGDRWVELARSNN
jgi:hypothetical protein